MKTHAEVQKALIRAGYSLGKGGPSDLGDDGFWGAMSRAALSSYQATNGLKTTGMPDAETLVHMFPGTVAPVITPPWLVEAKRLMGTREIAGAKNSPVIMGWAQKLKLWYPNDETAWCGLFVAHCMSVAMPGEPQPGGQLGARNWLKFGIALRDPAPGAVLVFWRGQKHGGWQGHVGFQIGERRSDGAFRVLGGNQGNTVSEVWLDRDRLLGIRWPSRYPLPLGGRVYLSASGALSRNEA